MADPTLEPAADLPGGPSDPITSEDLEYRLGAGPAGQTAHEVAAWRRLHHATTAMLADLDLDKLTERLDVAAIVGDGQLTRYTDQHGRIAVDARHLATVCRLLAAEHRRASDLDYRLSVSTNRRQVEIDEATATLGKLRDELAAANQRADEAERTSARALDERDEARRDLAAARQTIAALGTVTVTVEADTTAAEAALARLGEFAAQLAEVAGNTVGIVTTTDLADRIVAEAIEPAAEERTALIDDLERAVTALAENLNRGPD